MMVKLIFVHQQSKAQNMYPGFFCYHDIYVALHVFCPNSTIINIKKKTNLKIN